MNKPEDVRDQMRELKYLQEEDKLLKDILRKVEDQKNRLKVEELTLKKIAKDKNSSNLIANFIIKLFLILFDYLFIRFIFTVFC